MAKSFLTREIRRALDEQGFTYRRTAKNHWQIRDRRGAVVAYTGCSPSDVRGAKAFRADLRRAGFVWPG